ncbi:MAG: hypothetical protein AAGM16_00635 [Pseudomonadota bacterium]
MDIADPFARKLVAGYLKNRTKDVARLRTLLEEREFDAIRIAGHNLFGSGSAYGLDEVSQIGFGLEEAAASRDGKSVARLISQLADFLHGMVIE